MMTAEKAVAFIVRADIEGVFSDDPDDPGGVTKYGISQKAYPDLNIRDLTMTEAVAIYVRDYWTPLRCEDMPSAIRLPLLDSGVNQGVGRASKFLQGVVGAGVDGAIGPKTLAAVDAFSDQTTQLVDQFTFARLAHYTRLSRARKSQRKCMPHWSYRTLLARAEALGIEVRLK